MTRRLLALALCLGLFGLADRGAAALATRALLPLDGTSRSAGGPPIDAATAPPTPATPRPATPTPAPSGGPAEGSQFGHDPQRSGDASEGVATPWRLRWQWNGADASGQPQASHLSVPDLVQPITGG